MKVTSLTIPNDLEPCLDNFPCDEQAEIFINFFASISPNVTSLSLRKIHPFPYASIVARALASVPPNVNSIDLSDKNQDNFMPIGEFKEWFPFLPSSVVFLDLSHIEFGKQSDRTLLPKLVAVIPSGIKSLNLRGTGLGSYTVDQLKECFNLLPSNLNALKLGQNDFHTKSGWELASILSAIPDTVTFLDLSGECLGVRIFSEIAQILGAIPKNIHSLDLSWNQ